jgi:hypothetical protein
VHQLGNGEGVLAAKDVLASLTDVAEILRDKGNEEILDDGKTDRRLEDFGRK